MQPSSSIGASYFHQSLLFLEFCLWSVIGVGESPPWDAWKERGCDEFVMESQSEVTMLVSHYANFKLEEVTPQPDTPAYRTVRDILPYILGDTYGSPKASGPDLRILRYDHRNIWYCPVGGCVRLGGDLF